MSQTDPKITSSKRAAKENVRKNAQNLLKKIVDRLVEKNIICDTLAFGDLKFMVFSLFSEIHESFYSSLKPMHISRVFVRWKMSHLTEE